MLTVVAAKLRRNGYSIGADGCTEGARINRARARSDISAATRSVFGHAGVSAVLPAPPARDADTGAEDKGYAISQKLNVAVAVIGTTHNGVFKSDSCAAISSLLDQPRAGLSRLKRSFCSSPRDA